MKAKAVIFFGLILIFSLLIGELAFSASIFTVVGTVKNADGTLAATGLEVVVTNETRHLTATTTIGRQEPGKYGVVFIDMENRTVAAEGDVLRVTVKDAQDITGTVTYKLTADDIAKGRAVVDVKLGIPIAPRFAVGDEVRVINTADSGLRIHKDEPVGETVKVVPDGWGFEILGGPLYDIGGYNWWEIREQKYETFPIEGWVAEDFIEKDFLGVIAPSSPPDYFVSAQEKVEEAIKWAEGQAGKTDWAGWCLKFVREAFNGNPIAGWTSAEAARQQLAAQGRFYSCSECWNPPRGALIFFSALDEYESLGHVGIYLGDQGIIHSYDKVRVDERRDNRSKGLVIAQNLAKIDSYIGWAYPPEEWFEETTPPTARDYVRSFIQRETKDKVTVTVEGGEYNILTLGRYLDPDTLVEYITTEEVKVYVDTEGNPVSDQEIARKIGIVDHIRRRQREGLEKEINDDFSALNTEMRVIGQMPLVEWVIETSKTVATAPIAVKEAVAGRALTEIAKIASKELISFPGKMSKEQLADRTRQFLQNGMNRYDQVRRTLIQNPEIADFDIALSVLESYLWGEADNEMASFLAYRLYYEKYVSAWNFFVSELKKAVSLGVSETTSATMISLDGQIKWEHTMAEVDYQLHGKAYEATEYTLRLAAVPFVPVSEYEEKIARLETLISEISKFLIDLLDKVASFLNFLSVVFHSPGEVRVYDSQGRVTGLVNGEVKEEIPDSLYDNEHKTVVIFSPSDSYRYDVLGTNEGEYGLEITLGKEGELTTFTATDVPTSPGVTHEYTVDWQILSQGEKGVTVQMDNNSDGIFEQTVITGEEFAYGATDVTPKDRCLNTWGSLKRTALFQNYPNPFNPDTWIPYVLAERSQVVIEIYDIAGQLIRTLDLGNKPAGAYLSSDKAACWDGCDDAGEPVTSGVYFYSFHAGSFQSVRKMTIVR